MERRFVWRRFSACARLVGAVNFVYKDLLGSYLLVCAVRKVQKLRFGLSVMCKAAAAFERGSAMLSHLDRAERAESERAKIYELIE